MGGYWLGTIRPAFAETIVNADQQAKSNTTESTIVTQVPPGFENLIAPSAKPAAPQKTEATNTTPAPAPITTQPPPGFENLLPSGTVPSATPSVKNDATISVQPPSGFEEMIKPEETNIDVFYGGIKLGSYPASYDLKTISFKDATPIVEQIPHLLPTTKPDILAALAKPLDTNLKAHCPKEVISQKDICGFLVPDVAGVVFYDDNFKADLFINPKYLQLQDTRLGVTLPKAEKIVSGVHSFNGTVNTTNGEDNNFSLLQNSIVSYGQARVSFASVLNQDQSYLDTAAFGLDRGGYLSRLGFFDTGHFQTLPQTRLAGVSVETSFDTNIDLKQTVGNQLTIYLPKRAWVTLLRDKTTYSSDFYEAGNQIIDTSQLPDGAYDLTLQINEGNGVTRDEKRFYAKNFNIPPSNVPIYYFQGGMLRDDQTLSTVPQLTNQSVIVAGTTRRLSAATGANIGIMHTDNNNFLETSLFGIFPKNNQLSVGGLVSQKGDFGASANFIGTAFKDRLGYAASIRQIWAVDSNNTLVPSVSTSPVVYNPTDAWQASSTLSYQLHNNVSLNFQYNETANGSLTKTRSYGPYLRWNVWQRDAASLMFFADANHSDTADTASAYLRFSYRLGKWGISADGGSRFTKTKTTGSTGNVGNTSNDDGTAPYGNTRLSWSDTDQPGRTVDGGLEFSKDSVSESERADIDYRNQNGRLKLDLAQNSQNGVDNTVGIGAFGFNILHGGAHMAAGGAREERSGLIVQANKLQHDNGKDPIAAKVTVNGSEVGIVKPGESLPILLNPYDTYKISAQPANSNLPVEVTTTAKDVTLYPGNVQPVMLDIQRIYIVIGRLVDEQNNPIANARLQQARGLVITDENGNFQAEVTDVNNLAFTYTEPVKAIAATSSTPAVATSAPEQTYNPAGVYNQPVETNDTAQIANAPLQPVHSNSHLSDIPYGPPRPDAVLSTTPAPVTERVAAEQISESNASVTSAEKSETNKAVAIPNDPSRIVPDNTPQWVRDAAELQASQTEAPVKRLCTVNITSFDEKNGVVIFKDALVCTHTDTKPDDSGENDQ